MEDDLCLLADSLVAEGRPLHVVGDGVNHMLHSVVIGSIYCIVEVWVDFVALNLDLTQRCASRLDNASHSCFDIWDQRCIQTSEDDIRNL